MWSPGKTRKSGCYPYEGTFAINWVLTCTLGEHTVRDILFFIWVASEPWLVADLRICYEHVLAIKRHMPYLGPLLFLLDSASHCCSSYHFCASGSYICLLATYVLDSYLLIKPSLLSSIYISDADKMNIQDGFMWKITIWDCRRVQIYPVWWYLDV